MAKNPFDDLIPSGGAGVATEFKDPYAAQLQDDIRTLRDEERAASQHPSGGSDLLFRTDPASVSRRASIKTKKEQLENYYQRNPGTRPKLKPVPLSTPQDAPAEKNPFDDILPGANLPDETVTESTPGAVRLPGGGYGIPANNPTASLPEEVFPKKPLDPYIEGLNPYWRSFMTGINRLDADIMSAPGAVAQIAYLPQNLLGKWMGIKALQVEVPKEIINNKFAKYFDEAAESYEYVSKRWPDEDMFSLAKKSPKEAGEYLAHQVVMNAPQQLAILLGNLSGAGEAATLGSMALTAASRSMKEGSKKGMDPIDNALNSITQGGLEYAFEHAGTFGLLDSAKEVFKKAGKRAGKQLMKNILKVSLADVVGEANEEFWTSLAQDFSNKVYGAEDVPFKMFLPRALQAGVIGGLSGATMTTPMTAGYGIQHAQAQKRQRAAQLIQKIMQRKMAVKKSKKPIVLQPETTPSQEASGLPRELNPGKETGNPFDDIIPDPKEQGKAPEKTQEAPKKSTPEVKPAEAVKQPPKQARPKAAREFSEAHRDTMAALIDAIGQIDAKARMPIRDEDGHITGWMVKGFVPDHLKNVGISVAEDIALLKKAIDGAPLTEKQYNKINTLIDLQLEHERKMYEETIRTDSASVSQPEAAEAIRVANQAEPVEESPELPKSKGPVSEIANEEGDASFDTEELKTPTEETPAGKQTLIPGTERTLPEGKLAPKKAQEDIDLMGQKEAAAKEEEKKQGELPETTSEEPQPKTPEAVMGEAQSSTPEKIDDVGEKIGGARKDTSVHLGSRGQKQKSEDPGWRKRYQVNQIAKSSKPEEDGKWAIVDTRKEDYLGQKRRMPGVYDTEESAKAAIPLIAVARNHRVYQNKDGKFEIWRDVAERKRVKVIDKQFDSRDEAMKYIAMNAEAIVETKTSFGEEILPRPDNVVRKGEDYRAGRDVNAEDFRQAFGFRAVEFGLWNNQAERQEVMNHAYDALMDMAAIINIPPKAVGLNGDLALAFGARGQGLSGARAHYERDYAVINLTKMQGAGSLAHEWFHATDHYFARQDTKAKSEKTNDGPGKPIYKSSGRETDYASHGLSGERSQVRTEVRAAYEALIKTVFYRAVKYKEDTAKVDKFVGEARADVEKGLEKIRAYIATKRDDTYSKRNNAPATASQLAAFDETANKIINGEMLSTTFKANNKTGARFVFSGRWTNDALEALSVIYKDVRGRSGFSSGNGEGVFDELRGRMTRYSQRLKLLADAQSGTEKTRYAPTEFAMEAKSIDQGRASDYWTTPHEMAARAFEAYVDDKVKGGAKRSDFLAYGTNMAVATPWGWKKPYPAGEERKTINAAFDELFKNIKTKATEAGTAMYEPSAQYGFSNTFYSAVERSAKEKLPNSFSPEQALNAIKNTPGVKQDELDWLGLAEWLKGKGKVSKQELIDFIRANQVEIKEVTKGGPSQALRLREIEREFESNGMKIEREMGGEIIVVDEQGDIMDEGELEKTNPRLYKLAVEYSEFEGMEPSQGPKFGDPNTTLPGGKNYREVLLTLPKIGREKTEAEWAELARQHSESMTLDEVKKLYGEVRVGAFKSSHFDEPNVVVHFRLNDRQTEKGKTLFIEEIQSDWMQAGRKRGFKTDNDYSDMSKLMAENKVPDAPFKKTWHELALKRILRMAAEEGYDAIAWTSGEQQNERYDLSKKVEKIEWSRQVINHNNAVVKIHIIGKGSPESIMVAKDTGVILESHTGLDVVGKKLEDVIGKEISEKIRTAEISGKISGDGLKVGGEGMKGFYDQIIPAFLNKYTKKWGGRVSEVTISQAEGAYKTEVAEKNPDVMKRLEAKVHALEITPSMKESVMKGQALFEPGQGELFSKEELEKISKQGYSHLRGEGSAAYGTIEKYQEILRSAIHSLRGSLPGVPYGKLRREISALISKQGYVPTIGLKVETSQDLAEIVSVYRNPGLEIFQVIYVKDGVILAHHGTTLNIPGWAAVPKDLIDSIEQKAKSLGADKIYFAHNHPSGDPSPSKEDMLLNQKLIMKFRGKYGGHVITDGGEFTAIGSDNLATREKYKTPKIDFYEDADNLPKVNTPESLASAALQNFKKGKATLVFTDNQNKVIALEYVRDNANFPETIANKLRAYKAPKYGLVLDVDTATQFFDTETLANLPDGLIDVLGVKNGKYVSSVVEEGLYNPKGGEVKAMQVSPFLKGELAGTSNFELNTGLVNIGEKHLLRAFEKGGEYGLGEGIENPEDAEDALERYTKQGDLFFNPPAGDQAPTIGYANPQTMKDISGFKSGAMDPFRIFEEVFGDGFPKVVDELLYPFTEANGARVDMEKRILDELQNEVVKKLGIKRGSKESEAVQLYGEGKLDDIDLQKQFPDTWKNIVDADTWFRNKYDELLNEVNSALASIYPNRPDKLIPYRKSYYRHFREFAGLSGLKNIFETPANIASRLAGVSEFTKPKSKWLSFAQRRLGIQTEIDAVGGFLDYVPAAAYARHITPFIKEFRNLAKYLRAVTDGENNLNNFITFLDDYASLLAGKSNPLDRLLIKWMPGGRKTIRLLDWINARVKANVILGNFSSAVAQVFNVPQGIAETKQYSIPGFVDAVSWIFDKESPVSKSTFIKTRYADRLYDKFDIGILKHAKDFAKFFMSAADEVGTRFIWHSFYRKAIGIGAKNPILYADYLTRKMVAGRSVGEVPILQQSKLFQFVAPFQLEVGNLWWALRDQVKEKDFAGILLFLIASFLFNELAEKIRGSRVSLDLIDAIKDASSEDKTAFEKIGRLAGEIFSNVPLGQTLMSFYPQYGLKLPNGGRLPTREKFFGGESRVRFGSGLLALEGLKDPMAKILLPFGGQQVKRSREGFDAFRDGYYMRGKERVDIERTPKNFVKAVVFGKYSVPDKDEKEISQYKKIKARANRKESFERERLKTYVSNGMKNGASIRDLLRGKALSEKKKIYRYYQAEQRKAGAQSTLERSLLTTRSNVQKIALLARAGESMEQEAHFKKLLKGLVRKRLISIGVAGQAILSRRSQTRRKAA